MKSYGKIIIGLAVGLLAGPVLAKLSEHTVGFWLLKTAAFALVGISIGAVFHFAIGSSHGAKGGE